MDKGRRNEITKLKHKRRCKPFNIKPELNYCYKAQGVPCSCYACTGEKYKRKVKHKKDYSTEQETNIDS